MFIMGAFSFKHGEQAYKDLLANDVERRIMVENNVLRPLKLNEEYRPWKGFVMGALPCIPLVIFMIPHLIVVISGGSYQGFGYIASFLYYSFLAFADFFGSELTVYSYFWTLVALPVLSLTSGIPYLMGARKARIIEERILEQEKFIYGENK